MRIYCTLPAKFLSHSFLDCDEVLLLLVLKLVRVVAFTSILLYPMHLYEHLLRSSGRKDNLAPLINNVPHRHYPQHLYESATHHKHLQFPIQGS